MKQRTEKPQSGQMVESVLERPAGTVEYSRRGFLSFQVVAGGAVGAFLATSCAGADVVKSSAAAGEEEFSIDFIKTIGLSVTDTG